MNSVSIIYLLLLYGIIPVIIRNETPHSLINLNPVGDTSKHQWQPIVATHISPDWWSMTNEFIQSMLYRSDKSRYLDRKMDSSILFISYLFKCWK